MRLNLFAFLLLLPVASNASVQYKCTAYGGGHTGPENGVSMTLISDSKNVFQGVSVNDVEFKANADVEDSIDSDMKKITTYSADTKDADNANIQSVFVNVWRDNDGKKQVSLVVMNVKTGANYTGNQNDSYVSGNLSNAYCN